jgi:hypothetical protein
MNASSITGPDPKLGAKISLAGGGRKRRVDKRETPKPIFNIALRDTT